MATYAPAQSTQQKTELRDAELRTALAIGRLRPSGQSPLVQDGASFILPAEPPYDASTLESLYRKGLLGVTPEPTLVPEWQKVLTALADPLWDVSMIVWSKGGLKYDRYFSAGALTEGSLVYHQPGGEGHHVCHPYGPDYILKVLDETVDFSTPASSMDSGAELDYREYAVLTALVDLLRQRHLEAMLDRRLEISAEVTAEEVAAQLQKGREGDDPRWLVTLAGTVSPFEFKVDAPEISGLLDALQLKGYLVAPAGKTGVEASEVLLAMAESLLVIPAFLAFELTFIKSPETFEINYFAAIRGANVIWLLDFYELAAKYPRVSLTTVSGEELRLMLRRLMEESGEKTQQLLRARKAAPERPPELRRLPSPPTLRSLKVPGTVGALRSPGPSTGDLLVPPGASRTGFFPSAETGPAAPPPPPAIVAPSLPAGVAGEMVPPPESPRLPPFAPPRLEAPPPPPEPMPPVAPPEMPAPPPLPPVPATKAEPEPVAGIPSAVPPEGDLRLIPAFPRQEPPRPEAPPPEAEAPVWGPLLLPTPSTERPCPHCGLPVVLGKKFCRHCGKGQPPSPSPVEEPITPAAGPPAQVPLPPQGPTAPPQGPTAPPQAALAPPQAPSAPLPASPEAQGGTVICRICGLALSDTAAFCGHCGANVVAFRPSVPPVAEERKCPSCNGKIAPSARFCAFCGFMVG